MTRNLDDEFIKQIATHDSRIKSLRRYRTHIRFHVVLGLMTALLFFAFQFIGTSQAAPQLAFVALVNVWIAQKYYSTRQIILAVDHLERAKIEPSETTADR